MARLGTDAANTWAVMDVMDVTNALKGQRVCFTGHLGLARHELVRIIEKAGGECHDDVKSHTTILVTNRDFTKGTVSGNKSNKIRKAEQYRVKILSEQQFIDLIVENGESPADLQAS
jgi:NAD-dependent DNA ligase